jgi:hypothetical protein
MLYSIIIAALLAAVLMPSFLIGVELVVMAGLLTPLMKAKCLYRVLHGIGDCRAAG